MSEVAVVRDAASDAYLEVQVIVARRTVYEERPLPAAWAVFPAEAHLDAFVFSSRPLAVGQTLRVRVYAYCHISEDSALSHVLLTVPEGEQIDLSALRTYESTMGKFLHRHFEILGWGNLAAVKKLLALRYNITI